MTTIGEEKQTRRTTGKLLCNFMDMDAEGLTVRGYEIHMGESEAGKGSSHFAVLEDGTVDGVVSADKTVMGTYLHGIFDNDTFREKLLKALRDKQYISEESASFDFKAFKEEQYDLLADTVESSLDMGK